jgi:hypothetical protein
LRWPTDVDGIEATLWRADDGNIYISSRDA